MENVTSKADDGAVSIINVHVRLVDSSEGRRVVATIISHALPGAMHRAWPYFGAGPTPSQIEDLSQFVARNVATAVTTTRVARS